MLFKKYKQFDDLKVCSWGDSKLLSKNEKNDAIDAINLFKLKRNESIKGRTCVNGKPQKRYIYESETSFPTIALESLITFFWIESYENRDVTIYWRTRSVLKRTSTRKKLN